MAQQKQERPCCTAGPAAPFSINVLALAAESSTPSSPSATATYPLESLMPGVFRDESGPKPRLVVPSLRSPAYLQAELGLGRLDGLDRFSHSWFWLLGAPGLPRPLHDCLHRGRAVCVTERMDRHLGLGLGHGGGDGNGNGCLLYLKPLPRLLLDPRFWTDVLVGEAEGISTVTAALATPSSVAHLRACALGLLYSYAALVSCESDFRVARTHGLLPPEVSWTAWRLLVRQVVQSPEVQHRRFHARFLYGELPLQRLRELGVLPIADGGGSGSGGRGLGTSTRMSRGSPLRMHQRWHRLRRLLTVVAGRLDRVARFFQNNVRWLASLLAYTAVVLSALQTGLTTERLAASGPFQMAAAGFTVFALVGPLSVLLTLALYFGLSLAYHVGAHLVTMHLPAAVRNKMKTAGEGEGGEGGGSGDDALERGSNDLEKGHWNHNSDSS